MTDDKETAARLTGIAKQLRERCTMGVGCDEYGVCYADAHGQPEQCHRQASLAPHIEAQRQALEALERIIQGFQITPVGGGDGDTCTIQGAPSPAAVIEAREAITTLRANLEGTEHE